MPANDATDARGRPRVAVTGLGVQTPAGTTVDALASRLRSGRSTAATIQRFDPSPLSVRIGCEVTDFDPTTYLGAKEARRVDRVTQLGFAAASDARADAGAPGAEPEHASRPFAADRDGFVMGEGASALLLERWDRAVARGAHIYGEVVGYGRNADAYHITAPSPGGEGAAACMQLALDDAGLPPSALSHVHAHGTSTPLNDAAE